MKPLPQHVADDIRKLETLLKLATRRQLRKALKTVKS
jgi:hypothetical protein